MMKRLTALVLKSYLGPFLLTFFIALFVLVMQFLWKHVDDLAGKGLEWSIILELLFYASATLVPLALPLAILLSSIMTIGTMGEHLELVAARSNGISLLRLLRPLMVFVLGISIGAFLFSNYAMPVANFKFKSLFAAIRATRPAMDITEGVFYSGLTGVTLYVGEKNKNGQEIYNVMVYDHSQRGLGDARLTMAQKGTIQFTPDERYLILDLKDGIRYDGADFFTKQHGSYRFYREAFSRQQVWIDMSAFQIDTENNRDYLKNSYAMMNVFQLNKVFQDIHSDFAEQNRGVGRRQLDGFLFAPPKEMAFDMEPGKVALPKSNPKIEATAEAEPQKLSAGQPLKTTIDLQKQSLSRHLVKEEAREVYRQAEQQIQALHRNFTQQQSSWEMTQKNLASNRVEWHRKFTLSFACLVLFFIGAPLGAIIRKGGLGLPLILCILIFITYHIISTSAEKSVKSLNMDPVWGMWLSSLILFPFGLFLTLRISTDNKWFSLETYQNLWYRWRRKRK